MHTGRNKARLNKLILYHDIQTTQWPQRLQFYVNNSTARLLMRDLCVYFLKYRGAYPVTGGNLTRKNVIPTAPSRTYAGTPRNVGADAMKLL